MKEFYNYNKMIKDGKVLASVEKPVHFDAIILDLNMPIMRGDEACK